MKKVVAVIRPSKLNEVKVGLIKAEVLGITVSSLQSYGRLRGQTESYRGTTSTSDFRAGLKLEVVVEDDQVERVVEMILATAQTGQLGDGKIFVIPIEAITRIRTGEQNSEAL